jgi:hypothetical protein
MLLAGVYKSLQRIWNDTDITELLSFRKKDHPGSDLNAKHPVWNSKVADTTGLKLWGFSDTSNVEISTPQYLTHYTPGGIGTVLDTVVH